jgi:hypothetical protein
MARSLAVGLDKEQIKNEIASYSLVKLEVSMTYDRYPDRLKGSMTRGQANTLRSLSTEAYQPKLFAEDLTAEEAAKRIEALRQEIELANSF